jgi:glucose/arabinose dehydrogenase
MQHYLLLILSLLFFFHCGQPRSAQSSGDVTQVAQQEGEQESLPLDKIQLPEGFQVEIFAKDIEDARSLARGSEGTIFVGNRKEDKVYALVDRDGDHKVDQKYVIASGLKMPNGVAFKDGDLYVAELNRILRFPNIESQLENPPQYEVVYDKLPSIRHHGWKYLAFGPDGKLYVPVGAPCNICESKDEIFASISRLNPDGSGFEVYAHGVRNSVGFAWHPDSKELWFTDNGRDWMGDDLPPCELNRAAKAGQHFGYPYCHGGNISDPDFGDLRGCGEFVKPAQNLGAHVAPLGMLFYQGSQFPKAYNKQVLFAEHGSWNRSKKSGYKLSMARLEGNEVVSYEDFATGWLDEESQDFWGRPVDVLELPDGSLLVSDDFADVVYRISYKG